MKTVASKTDPAAKAPPASSVGIKSAPQMRGFFWFLDYVAYGRFLTEDSSPDQVRVDESGYLVKRQRLLKLIFRQTYVIIILVVLVMVLQPYLHPIHSYRALLISKQKQIKPLVPLYQPNLTDRAVLSWVESSITEILTFGFGNFDQQILGQKHRFTKTGWDGFVKSLVKEQIRTNFKEKQLVLTTAPANAPVIVSKGLDIDLDYVWVVEMPIIMTYTTNNKVMVADRSIVRLVISRVPSDENVRGLGIKKWEMH